MRTVAICALALGLLGCGDSCTGYSDFTCPEIEEATYNVYFYYPSEKEVFLGEVEGLAYCGDLAYDFAASKKMDEDSGWSYICCMIANNSDCYEKHR